MASSGLFGTWLALSPKLCKRKGLLAWYGILMAVGAFASDKAQQPKGGALAGDRPRLIVSTDIGGSDPDDFQSMIHLLLYADVLDLEGLISSPPGAGRTQHIFEVLHAYECDYADLSQRSSAYPTPPSLHTLVKQGALVPSPKQGWSVPTPGSDWMIERAHSDDDRPLWILVWGSITDVAQAVHDDPTIKQHIRIYSIGSWNTRMDHTARSYLYKNHHDLWWIEADSTFRGMYIGGFQDDDWGNLQFVQRHVRGHGALGDLFFKKKPDIKMGDTPSLLYLLRGDMNDPTSPHWGGAFAKQADRPTYWNDDDEPTLSEGNRLGAKTVNVWRCDILKDWRERMPNR